MTALEKLKSKTSQGFHICVGLDTDESKIPAYLKSTSNPVLEFNKIVIEETRGFASAYKINFAFYEKDGLKGIENLHATFEMLPTDLLNIADAKRGDIGNTSEMYARSIFDKFGFDAVTLHPYMGFDSVEPFLKYGDKLNFILCLTSNAGAADFEKLKTDDGSYLYEHVLSKAGKWNTRKNVGLVFGATKIEELKENIPAFNEMPVLLPGVGAQGGSLEDVVSLFKLHNKSEFIINVSRALIYCDDTPEFPSTVGEIIRNLNSSVRNLLN